MKKLIRNSVWGLLGIAFYFSLLGDLSWAGSDTFKTLCQDIGFNPAEDGSFYFIQISDTHVTKDNNGYIPEFTKQIESLEPKPAFVVHTGDLINGASASDYEALYTLITDFEQRLPDVPLKLVFGNHDTNLHNEEEFFLNLYPKQKRHYYFDSGRIRFIVLFPYPSSTDAFFGLGSKQIEFVKGLIKTLPGKELVIFIHASPTPPNWQDPWTGSMLVDFKSALSDVEPEIKVWVISGHWHCSRLSRLTGLMRENRPIYAAVGPSLVDNKSYRLFFVRRGKIIASALREDKDGSFIIDSPSDTWEEYQIFPPIPSEYTPLVFINSPEDDKPYLVEEKNSKEYRTVREIKGKDGFLVYDLKNIPREADNLAMRILWRHLIEFSPDGKVWTKVANSEESKEYVYYGDGWLVIFPLPAHAVKNERVFIRLRDPNPNAEYAQPGGWWYEQHPSMDWFSLISSQKPKKVSTSPLVSYWKFDEEKGERVIDSSEYGNDGDINGAEWVDGIKGKGLYFNGKFAYVSIPASNSLYIPGDITISFWYKLEKEPDGWGPVINLGGVHYRGGRDVRENRIILRTSTDITCNIEPEPGKWTHVCYVVDTNGKEITAYMNGEKVSSQKYEEELVKPGRGIVIGKAEGEKYFKGVIDEIKIYKKVLSEKEIETLYLFDKQGTK